MQQDFDAILFDLDGTLLQVEMGEFIPRYLAKLSAWFAPEIEPERFQTAMRGAISGLLQARNGELTNEELVLQVLEKRLGLGRDRFADTFRRWLRAEGDSLQPLITKHPLAAALLEVVFSAGFRVVIATNPVFPRTLIDARLRWAGLAGFGFDLVTSYENSRHCKPNPAYFREILAALQLPPDRCLMVGNDTHHDLAAARAGIPTFLVETWLVDRGGCAQAPQFRGDHRQLLEFLRALPAPRERS